MLLIPVERSGWIWLIEMALDDALVAFYQMYLDNKSYVKNRLVSVFW